MAAFRWLKFLGVYVVIEYALTAVTGFPGFFQIFWMRQVYGVDPSTHAMFYYLLAAPTFLLPLHVYAAWQLSA